VNDTVRRVLTTLVILACIGGLIVAVQHTRRGDEEEGVAISGAQASKTIVELLAPTPESSVLSQAQLLIDLTPSYSASFVVNGVTIPDDELQLRPELSQVIYNPGPGKTVEKWATRTCIEADIYRIDGVAEEVGPVTWCFNVT
jgi:hypothetical protein